ncbi:MAG: choice-of-anchor B family protein [Actinomycetota bacterium]|nr:choice-of-anchor B family protein [Actinomycetota bacterium]
MPQPLGPQPCENGMAGPYPCHNVDLESFVPLPMLGGATGNDIWGWTDPQTGREYALMGTSNSTGFVDVTDPRNPVLVGTLPTRGRPDFVLWRDIKVDGNYAFIVSEITRSGLQVFDLTRLRDAGPTPQVFTADATYDEFSFAHNISINRETDTAYVVGSNTCARNGERGGLHMVDISTPTAPRFAGCATVGDFAGTEPNNYVHDVECVIYRGPDADYRGREICFGSNENVVAIYDVTDRSNPRVISTRGYDTASYTHQGTLTEDHRFFLFGDELDEQDHGRNTTSYVLDVSDLDAPPPPQLHTHETKSIDHNMYVHGNRVFQSNYTAGLRVLDFNRGSLKRGELREEAYFDVVPGVDIAEFAGTWSNYRFPNSGTVVVSTIENQVSGLFVLRPHSQPGPG